MLWNVKDKMLLITLLSLVAFARAGQVMKTHLDGCPAVKPQPK
jgi:hypothetical protein